MLYLPGKFMKSKVPKEVRDYLAQLASKGGTARAKKYNKATLSEWARKGGRPPKKKKGSK
jgi:hypothetical protein